MRKFKPTIQQGFTLVELLIVVIILAILAAIIVPQFSASTKDATDAAVRSNLAAVRSAIDMYRQQHGGDYPGAKSAIGPASCTATKGAGAATDGPTRADAFNEQLTLYTNANGEACSSPMAGLFPYGPYLRSADLPVNPVTSAPSSVVDAVDVGDLQMTGTVNAHGWKFDVKTGRFIANTQLSDSKNVRYDSY